VVRCAPICLCCGPLWSVAVISHTPYSVKTQACILARCAHRTEIRFFTKRLQGIWRLGYNDRLRLLNTHSLEYRHLYSDLVLCFQQLSNSFNSQLANVLIKSTDNRTRGHDFKVIKQTCSVDATKYYFTNRVVNVWNSLPSHIVSSPTLSTFKSRLGKHDFSVLLVLFVTDYCVACGFYRAMHFSAKRGIAIACRLSVTLVDCEGKIKGKA